MRLALIAAALCVAGLSVAAALSAAADARRAALAQAQARADGLTSSLSQHTIHSFHAVRAVLRLAATEHANRLEHGGDVAGMNATLADLTREVPVLRAMMILDRAGTVVADSRPAPARPFDASDRAYFLVHRDNPKHGFFISEPVRGRVTEGWRFVASLRLQDALGGFQGVVIAAFSPEQLAANYRDQTPDDALRVTLYRNDGTVLARYPSDPQVVGQVSAEFAGFEPATGENRTASAVLPLGERRTVHRAIEGLPLVVAVAYDSEAVLAPWRRSLGGYVLRAVGAVAVTLVVMSLLLVMLHHRERASRAQAVSERRLSDLVASMSDWVWEQDAELRFTYVADHHLKRVGLDASKMLGKRREEIAADPDTEEMRRHKEDLAARRPFRDLLVGRRLSDGRVVYFSISGYPIFDESGQFRGYRGTGRDVTGTKTAELRAEAAAAEVQRSRDLLRAVLNNVPARIHLKGPDHRYLMVNDEQLKQWGATLGDVLGKRFEDVPLADVAAAEHARRGAEMAAREAAVIASGKAENFYQEAYSRAHGTVRSYLASKTPLFDESGTPNAILTVAVDVTDIRKAEQQAKTAAEELARSRDLLQVVLDTVPARISVKDADQRFVLTNKAQIEAWDVTMDSVRGKRMEEIDTPSMSPDTRRDFIASVERRDKHVLETGRPVLSHEDVLPGPDGEPINWLSSKVPLSDADGRVNGILSVAIDVTAIKHAELKAKTAADELAKSRDLLQAVLDTVPALINVKDRERRYIMMNKAHLDDCRLPLEAVLGKRLEELNVPTIKPEEFPVFAANAAARDKELLGGAAAQVNFEESFTTPDGRQVHWLTSKIPLGGANGAPFAILTAAIDITDRKNAELKMAEANQRLADYAETSSDWLWETDTEHRFSMMSDGLRRVLGIDPALTIGKLRWEIALDRNDDTVKWRAHMEDLKAHRPFRNMVFHAEIGGRRLYISSSGKPVFDALGRFAGYRGIGRDVTAEMQLKSALIEAKNAAEVASRAKSEFLANMSHELRTPLNAVIGFSDMLASGLAGALHGKQSEYLRDIGASGRHLLDVINDVLDLAKIEAGRMELRDELLDVAGVVSDCTRLVRERARLGGIILEERVAPALRLRGDVLALKKILTNLMSNAVKFTPERGRVTIDAGVDAAGQCVFTVADTGIGMSPDEVQTALEPFGQIDSAMTRRNQGTGLGLPLAVSLAEHLGGRLLIDSAPGKGTTVTVLLPAERVLHSAA